MLLERHARRKVVRHGIAVPENVNDLSMRQVKREHSPEQGGDDEDRQQQWIGLVQMIMLRASTGGKDRAVRLHANLPADGSGEGEEHMMLVRP